MSHHVIEFDQECKSCKGTGLYSGMGESSECAVICHTCEGTGCHHIKIEYDDFEGRKRKPGIKHVYESNPGIKVGNGNGYKFEDFGGIPYNQWLETGAFPPMSENRLSTCPAWWYQTANYKKKPDWDWCIGIGAFSGCKRFQGKSACWDRWDKEFGQMP